MVGTCFNPRSPRGERRLAGTGGYIWAPFQSALPARGATVDEGRVTGDADVSIRAPRAGSDHDLDAGVEPPVVFQSALPARGATAEIHRRGIREGVSIRAPRAGSDHRSLAPVRRRRRFNPRSPRGERRPSPVGLRTGYGFNPRSPRGERPWCPAPLRPARPGFNPRSPRGERPGKRGCHAVNAGFNPRSPRGERRSRPASSTVRRCFNPRSPRGERPDKAFVLKTLEMFQSALPARGATSAGTPRYASRYGFNPRSPRGERRR